MSKELKSFTDQLVASVLEQKLIKLTFGKTIKSNELVNIYGKIVSIKKELMLSLTYRYKTRDEVKNISVSEIGVFVEGLVPTDFKHLLLITDTQELTLMYSKKFKPTLKSVEVAREKYEVLDHDKQKIKHISLNESFLIELGVSTQEGELIPKMADKYRQINKYIEIIESHLRRIDCTKRLNVVDMGSGKGYLTFALYRYLQDKNIDCIIKGVELRDELVEKCNRIANKCGLDGLEFVSKRIEDFKSSEIDVLIALHACDTATDDAIAAGVKNDAQLLVCAPCCHKQVRKAIDFNQTTNPILSHGIFIERSCEMLTDTVRAMVLESKGYKTKVFEFVSQEHTRKNIMLTGIKTGEIRDLSLEIKNLKQQYGLDEHYLEGVIG